ncbi:hypothetical protein FHS78_001020 [Parvibaculum indicum]|uniref:hypothetical protein n=1 Tax=Parvibaculum indicum TaxID=562969 RepID=UPI00142262A3|nr:hypothetical protein [Parvibaculum indicum]NIJ40744.1 hypothetical protein [Parvibaculum indicum]
MVSILKRMFGKAIPHRRRVSYYDSQTFMRRALENTGFIDLIRFSDEELEQVIAANKNSGWVDAARREMKTRREIRQKLGIREGERQEFPGRDGLAAE